MLGTAAERGSGQSHAAGQRLPEAARCHPRLLGERRPAPDPSSEPERRRRPWADRDVDVFDGLDMADYISERRMDTCVRHPDRKVSPDSVRLEVRFLSCVFKFAVQKRYRTTNPALARLHGFKIPSPNRRETRIAPEQEQALVVKAFEAIADSNLTNPALFPWLDLVRTTGCRPGEAAKIELAWVNLDKKCIDSVSREGHCVPYRYGSAWARLREDAGVEAAAHGWRREMISRLFEDSTLTDGQIALLVADLNVASLEPYKYLRSEKLRDAFQEHLQSQKMATEDAHAAAVREALENLKRLGISLSEDQKKIFAGEPLAEMVDPAPGRVHLPARKQRAGAGIAWRETEARSRWCPGPESNRHGLAADRF